MPDIRFEVRCPFCDTGVRLDGKLNGHHPGPRGILCGMTREIHCPGCARPIEVRVEA